MLERLKHKDNLVFVGGFALYKHGLVKGYTDYDIVVTDIEGLGQVNVYLTESAFSKTGERGYIIEENNKVDILSLIHI